MTLSPRLKGPVLQGSPSEHPFLLYLFLQWESWSGFLRCVEDRPFWGIFLQSFCVTPGSWGGFLQGITRAHMRLTAVLHSAGIAACIRGHWVSGKWGWVVSVRMLWFPVCLVCHKYATQWSNSGPTPDLFWNKMWFFMLKELLWYVETENALKESVCLVRIRGNAVEARLRCRYLQLINRWEYDNAENSQLKMPSKKNNFNTDAILTEKT